MKIFNGCMLVITAAVFVICGISVTASYAGVAPKASVQTMRLTRPAPVKPIVATTKKASRKVVITPAEKSAILTMQRTPISAWKNQKLSPGLNMMHNGKIGRVPAGIYRGAVTDVYVDTQRKVVAIGLNSIATGKIQSKFPIEGAASVEGPIMIKRSGLDRITKVHTKDGNIYYGIDGNWYGSDGSKINNSWIVNEGVSDVSFITGINEASIRNQLKVGDPGNDSTWPTQPGNAGYGGDAGGGADDGVDFEMDIIYGDGVDEGEGGGEVDLGSIDISGASGTGIGDSGDDTIGFGSGVIGDDGGGGGGGYFDGGGGGGFDGGGGDNSGDPGDSGDDSGGGGGDTSGDGSGDSGDTSGDTTGEGGDDGEEACPPGENCDDWPPLDDFIGSLILVNLVTDVTGNSSVSLGHEAGGGPTGPLMRGPAANVWICPDYGGPHPGIGKVGSSTASSFGEGSPAGGGVCPSGGDPKPFLMGNTAAPQQQMMNVPK